MLCMRFVLSFLVAWMTTSSGIAQMPFIKGVYGDPAAILKNGMSFTELGINAVFVRSASLDQALYNALRDQDIRIFVEFPTLNGQGYIDEHQEAWPVNEKGERAPAADWFRGVCLTDTGFQQYRDEQLRSLLDTFEVDGVWLDYLHWHAQFETPEPILPETCFCDRCIQLFQQASSLSVPDGPIPQQASWILTNADSLWRLWRSRVLTDWVVRMKSMVNEQQPEALLGIYYCPWYPEDFGGALYRTLGLDMEALAEIADVFSPMLYHHMMARTPDWVGAYVKWLESEGIAGNDPLIWPIVQAHNKPGVISTEEFRQAMWNGSRAPASGIMMFTLHSLLNEPGKMQVMRDLYKKRK